MVENQILLGPPLPLDEGFSPWYVLRSFLVRLYVTLITLVVGVVRVAL